MDDALEGLASRETLHGYTCAKTKQEVSPPDRQPAYNHSGTEHTGVLEGERKSSPNFLLLL